MANIYFLLLVVLQVFPIFGAAAPQVAMLPLAAILIITGVKDAIEDYRRHSLDNEVNNSAVTRLTNWINVNQPAGNRSIFQRIFGIAPSSRKTTKVSKGVRKLRAKEGSLNTDFLHESAQMSKSSSMQSLADVHTVPTLVRESSGGHLTSIDLEEVESIGHDSTAHSSFTINNNNSGSNAFSGRPNSPSYANRNRSFTIASTQAPSYRTTGGFSGVVDYSRQTNGTAAWERTLWKKLEVGDVILLTENDQIPADIVVLSTSDQDGACFVETKNLDGETNLKARHSLKATMGIQREEDIEHAAFHIDSEPPHANLYSYNAVLKYQTRESSVTGKSVPPVELKEAITINELLLRGCALRNTAWVIGLVAFTGADTKIMLNQGQTPSKRSKIEKETNFNVIANFVILFGMCLACAIADGFYLAKDQTSQAFYEPGNDGSSITAVNAIVTFG